MKFLTKIIFILFSIILTTKVLAGEEYQGLSFSNDYANYVMSYTIYNLDDRSKQASGDVTLTGFNKIDNSVLGLDGIAVDDSHKLLEVKIQVTDTQQKDKPVVIKFEWEFTMDSGGKGFRYISGQCSGYCSLLNDNYFDPSSGTWGWHLNPKPKTTK